MQATLTSLLALRKIWIGKFGMDFYMPLSNVSETIGVAEEIIKTTLERREPDIEPYLRVVSARAEGSGTTRPQLELRVDGLAPLIKKLSYNIPTDDIIENLICQVVHLTHTTEMNAILEEENQALRDENQHLRATFAALDEENDELAAKVEENQQLHAQVEDLTTQLKEKENQTWVTRLFPGRN